ncbi:rod shape-determining protein RodA [Kamptonema cortianum]|nr:rod shape-determining protein RodA [Kamptonema cortianum]MDL5048067.1 rod shape-determining protein RodA [Oscillatoria amoena NRMC-F 0135]
MNDFNPRKIFDQSWTIFFSMLVLCTVGILFIKSAQSGTDIIALNTAWKSQLKWLGLGILGYFTVMTVDFRRYISFAPFIYAIALFFLIFVLLPTPWSKEVYGSRSWLYFGSFHIQPAEMAKVALILLLSYYLGRPKLNLKKINYLVMSLLLLGIPLALILKQPDLGSAMVMVPLAFVMMFVAGISKRYLITLVLAGCLFASAIYFDMVPGFKLKPYMKARITSFIDPKSDPRGSGYQLLQTLNAIGTGGTWGKGYGNSTQNRLGYLPRNVAHTDSIFAVIAEEIGFAGSCAILFFYTVMLGAIIRVASRVTDTSGRLLCTGVATMLFIHLFQNVGMTIGVMPITGIPLPLISHGGSFLIITLCALGLVQSVWIHRKSYPGATSVVPGLKPLRT